MTNEDIVNSSAFKAINLLIDQKAVELQAFLNHLPEVIEQYRETRYQPTIDTRVSYEPGGREAGELPVPFSPTSLTRISEQLLDAVQLDKDIDDLQRFKLRLLNDWDFTHGNMAEQKAVFGETSDD